MSFPSICIEIGDAKDVVTDGRACQGGLVPLHWKGWNFGAGSGDTMSLISFCWDPLLCFVPRTWQRAWSNCGFGLHADAVGPAIPIPIPIPIPISVFISIRIRIQFAFRLASLDPAMAPAMALCCPPGVSCSVGIYANELRWGDRGE